MYQDDDLGDLENDDLNEQQDFDYDEDLMDGGDDQKNDNQIQKQRRQSTPYQQSQNQQEEEDVEEGEVYQYEEEDVSEEIPNNKDELEEEVIEGDEENVENVEDEQNQDEDQQDPEDEYEEDQQYEEEFDQDEETKQQQQIKQPREETEFIRPKEKKIRPPLPKPIKQKPSYSEKYAELLTVVDYNEWKPKQLHEENKILRQNLKEISDEVTKLVEENALKLPMQQPIAPQPSKRQKTAQSSGSIIDKEIEINQKKLEQQSVEIEKLQSRSKEVQDVEFINNLDTEIKGLEDLMKKLETQKKFEFLKQKQRGKELDKLENQDGMNKLLKEKNDLNRELVNARKKTVDLKEQYKKQLDTIKQIKDSDLPEINKDLEKLEREATELRIDVSGEKPFSKQREQYILLTAQKDSLLKHCQIMEKKEKQLDLMDKEIKELKKEKDRMDAQINQNEMILIDQRRQKEELKNKVPADVFKSIPATMTQENITQALQNEKKQQESQRKLQSAKPPISKPLQDQNQKELKLPPKNEEAKQVKFSDQPVSKTDVEEEIVIEEEEDQPKQEQKHIVQQKQQIPASQSTPIKQEITPQSVSPNSNIQAPQAKLNTKPFNLLRKSPDQQPSVDLGQSNISNQQSNTSENQGQSEYAGPSRVMRMMRRPQQQEEAAFIIHEAKPAEQQRQINKESKDAQPTIIQPKAQEQQQQLYQSIENKPVESKPVEEYQPTFPSRRISNRPRGLDFQYDSNATNNTEQQSQIATQQNEQPSPQSQQQEFPTRRRMRGEEQPQEQIQPPQQQSQQPVQQQKEENIGNNRRIKIFSTDEKQPEAPKTEEPGYEFQPRQEPGKMQGRRNRGNNKLNIWEEQPQQKENIEEIPEVKDVKYVPDVQPKQDREPTLDEILGGPKQEEYRPNQQRRKFEVPQEDTGSKGYEPGFGGGGKRGGFGQKQNDKQKELALQAEKGDFLDDFEF